MRYVGSLMSFSVGDSLGLDFGNGLTDCSRGGHSGSMMRFDRQPTKTLGFGSAAFIFSAQRLYTTFHFLQNIAQYISWIVAFTPLIYQYVVRGAPRTEHPK